MFEIGFGLLIVGAALFISCFIANEPEFFLPPACICIILSMFFLVFGSAISNETTPNISATQTIQSIQEQSDINNYNYCPTCGNEIKEE